MLYLYYFILSLFILPQIVADVSRIQSQIELLEKQTNQKIQTFEDTISLERRRKQSEAAYCMSKLYIIIYRYVFI